MTTIKRLDHPDGTVAMAPHLAAKMVHERTFPTGRLTGVFRLHFEPPSIHQNATAGDHHHDNLVVRISWPDKSLLYFFIDATSAIIPVMVKENGDPDAQLCAAYEAIDFDGGKASPEDIVKALELIEAGKEYQPYGAVITQ